LWGHRTCTTVVTVCKASALQVCAHLTVRLCRAHIVESPYLYHRCHCMQRLTIASMCTLHGEIVQGSCWWGHRTCTAVVTVCKALALQVCAHCMVRLCMAHIVGSPHLYRRFHCMQISTASMCTLHGEIVQGSRWWGHRTCTAVFTVCKALALQVWAHPTLRLCRAHIVGSPYLYHRFHCMQRLSTASMCSSYAEIVQGSHCGITALVPPLSLYAKP